MAKLIEKDFPFASLSLIAERESWRKEIYRPVYYLQKWWARRLGSVFRGILLSACLDEKENFWDHFYGSNAFDETTVFDPFMGSGVTIGEAIKLGCRAIGRDINPVAFFGCRAAFSQYALMDVLAEFQRLKHTLAPRLLNYFRTQTGAGELAIVLYYFLVKVVSCPECGNNIDLFNTRIFSKNAVPLKDPSARSLCPFCGDINHIFFNSEKAVCPRCAGSYNPQEGNIKGPDVCCSHCQYRFRLVDKMKSMNGPLPHRRYAKMLVTADGQKYYELMNEYDKRLEAQVADEYAGVVNKLPNVGIEPGYNTNQMLRHNYKHWHELFSDRQLVCIRYLLDSIKQIKDIDLRVLFACLFSGVLEFNNLFTSFKGEGTGAVRHMFSHHVLKPEMMPLEANIWGTNKSSGSFSTLFHSRVERALAYKSDPFELQVTGSKSKKIVRINQPLSASIVDRFKEFTRQPKTVYLSSGDSSSLDIPEKSIDLVVTDPPFFDNVHYSQLADFFYYWLNQALDISPTITTRSINEVQDTDPLQFTTKLTAVFAECHRILKDTGLFIFTYHHARHEGWVSVHRAIRCSGFLCTQVYPIKAEMSVAVPLKQAKSPIHLDLIIVCRKDLGDFPSRASLDPLSAALADAESQISSLKSAGIKVSLGDAKVIFMGLLLREAHRMRNPDLEEKFLSELERDIDVYVARIVSSEGEVLYQKAAPQQLMLFEQIREYLHSQAQQRKADGRERL